MALTTEQLNIIQSNRKDPRPVYFNAALGVETTISTDFEGFLILLEDTDKDQLITFLQQAKTDNNQMKDRDELIALALQNETTDSQLVKDAIDANAAEFAEFRNNLSVENFEQATEVGLLLNDLQRSLGEDVFKLDRMTHLNIFSKVTNQFFTQGQVTDNVIKEIDSWISVITEYKGLGVSNSFL